MTKKNERFIDLGLRDHFTPELRDPGLRYYGCTRCGLVVFNKKLHLSVCPPRIEVYR